MALKLVRIPTITGPVDNVEEVVDNINMVIDEINRALQEIELAQSKLEGTDNHTPTFQSAPNLNNFRVTNVARSRDPQDVVTRRELEEIGILGSRRNGLSLSGDITVDGNVFITGPTEGGSNAVPTITQVSTLITTNIEANVPSTSDGNLWVREDAAGIDGSTQGTVAMGVDGNGKARPIEIRNGELPIQDSEVRYLLACILEQLEKLNAN